MTDELYDPRRCPLVDSDIDVGYCLEVNYERLNYFKPDALADMMKRSGLSVDQVSDVCEACPHQPLK